MRHPTHATPEQITRALVRDVNEAIRRNVSIYVSRGDGPRVRVARACTRAGILHFLPLTHAEPEWFAVAPDEPYQVEAL